MARKQSAITISTKLVVGDKVKGSFKTVIEEPKPIGVNKVDDTIKTKILRNSNYIPTVDPAIEIVSGLDADDSPKLNTRIVRAGEYNGTVNSIEADKVFDKKVKENKEPKPKTKEAKTNTKTDKKEEEIKMEEKEKIVGERESTDEEMEMFDSISLRDSSSWTAAEEKFMALYDDNHQPDIETMEAAIDEIMIERESEDESIDDSDEEYEEELPKKKGSKATKKKDITEEF